jgi:hydroxymethylglutaryl-CoA lyase
MQGIHQFIPTEKKIEYLNTLLKAGFDTIDFGSFVSPKMIPQLRDTAEVYAALDLKHTVSKLLAIVANERGAQQACALEHIHYLGFPFSISETFQLRNTNSTIAQSLERVRTINALCKEHGKELQIYISMGFGNPYGEPWSPQVVVDWVQQLSDIGIRTIALSDTIGVSNPENITYLFSTLAPAFEHIDFGAHLHTHPHNWREKVEAAYKSGCKRFDGAIKGFGGCPMADDDLVGNMPTEHLVAYFEELGIPCGVQEVPFGKAMEQALTVFP